MYSIVLFVLGLVCTTGVIAITHGLPLLQQTAIAICFIVTFGWAVFMTVAVQDQKAKIAVSPHQENLADIHDFNTEQIAKISNQFNSLNSFEISAIKQLSRNEGMTGAHFYRYIADQGFPAGSRQHQDEIENVFGRISEKTTMLLDRNPTTGQWFIKPGINKQVAYLLSSH